MKIQSASWYLIWYRGIQTQSFPYFWWQENWPTKRQYGTRLMTECSSFIYDRPQENALRYWVKVGWLDKPWHFVRHVFHGIVNLHPRPVAKDVLQLGTRIITKSHGKLTWPVYIGYRKGTLAWVEVKRVRCLIIKKPPMDVVGWFAQGEPLDKIVVIRQNTKQDIRHLVSIFNGNFK